MNLNRNYSCFVMSTFLAECPISPTTTTTTEMTGKTNRVCTRNVKDSSWILQYLHPTSQHHSHHHHCLHQLPVMLLSFSHVLTNLIIGFFPLSYDRYYTWSCVGIWYWCDTIVTGSSSDTGSGFSTIVLLVEEKEENIQDMLQVIICESEWYIVLQ